MRGDVGEGFNECLVVDTPSVGFIDFPNSDSGFLGACNKSSEDPFGLPALIKQLMKKPGSASKIILQINFVHPAAKPKLSSYRTILTSFTIHVLINREVLIFQDAVFVLML